MSETHGVENPLWVSGHVQWLIFVSLNLIRLLRVVITPSLLRGENDSKQSDEFQAIIYVRKQALYNKIP